MAISKTTFAERLGRIDAGQTVDAAALVGRRKKPRRSLRARVLTFPFIVGVGILTGGTAYAWVSSTSQMHWVLALAY